MGRPTVFVRRVELRPLIVILAVALWACDSEHRLTPTDVSARPLTELVGLQPQEHDAVQAAIERLASEGAEPGDFYLAPIERRTAAKLELRLWYKSAFEEPMVVGNPGGKSRTMVYDTDRNAIVEDLLWQ